jgi:glycosyltransferase involved in cell wall biosynthesis
VLQPLALDQLPGRLRARARVIYQSVDPSGAEDLEQDRAAVRSADGFTVAQLAHLRPVKDPLLPADAVRLLPESSSVRVLHAGAVIDPGLGERAAAENRANPRFTWLGALPPARARRLLASSRALVHPSRHEGGANVVSEALAMGVPVLATRIPGTVGILGRDYPGYFPVGDPAALASLLTAVEGDTGLYDELSRRCAALRLLTSPARERASWQSLLAELAR